MILATTAVVVTAGVCMILRLLFALVSSGPLQKYIRVAFCHSHVLPPYFEILLGHGTPSVKASWRRGFSYRHPRVATLLSSHTLARHVSSLLNASFTKPSYFLSRNCHIFFHETVIFSFTHLSKTDTSSACVAMATRIPGMKCKMLSTATFVSMMKNEKPVMKAQIWPRLMPSTKSSSAGSTGLSSSVSDALRREWAKQSNSDRVPGTHVVVPAIGNNSGFR